MNQTHTTLPATYLSVAIIIMAWPNLASAQTPIGIEDHSRDDSLPFIWTQSPFSRWPSGVIEWCYFEAGVPKLLEPPGRMSLLIKLAFDQWQHAANLLFVAMSDSNCNRASERQQVHFRWSEDLMPRMSANTLVRWGLSDEVKRFGYEPILAATTYLNSRSRMVEKLTRVFTSHRDWEADMLQVLTHEIGHVLGLGHSEFPDSVMYANPYVPWLTLGESDIAQVQALYGPAESSKSAVDLSVKLLEAHGFVQSKAEQWPRAGVSMKSSLVEVDGWMFANFEYPDSEVETLAFDVVQADGNVRIARRIERPFISVACNKVGRCGASYSIAQAQLLRGLSAGTFVRQFINDRLVGRHAIPTDSTLGPNGMPTASLSLQSPVVRPDEEVALELRVEADPEGDNLVATLHVPGTTWRTFSVNRDGEVYHTVLSFPESGVYEIFVTLDDGAPRYAGQGFPNSGGSQYARLVRRVALTVE